MDADELRPRALLNGLRASETFHGRRRIKAENKKIGLAAIKLVDSLPPTQTNKEIGNQLLRSALSVGAKYRAACRARSKPDFISKMGIVIEDTDESFHWLDMLCEAGSSKIDKIKPLMQEANELTAIFTASSKTAQANLNLRAKAR